MKYRKKPVTIEATQWFKDGDHPKVLPPEKSLLTSNVALCGHCKMLEVRNHHLIETLEGTMRVCPGDWIITGINGECYPCKPDIFDKTYEPVKEVQG